MSYGLFVLHTHNGSTIQQPSTSQLSTAIRELAAPANAYVSVQPQPDTGWYLEIALPDPDTADVFNGPFEIHFQDSEATPGKWSIHGDDPDTIAARAMQWVHSMIAARS